MVRWASGVTLIIETAVAGPPTRGAFSNRAPMARMSWAKTSPSLSLATLPMKAPLPPKLARPAMVLAAEPPEASTAACILP